MAETRPFGVLPTICALLLILASSLSAFASQTTKELESLRITIDTDWAPQGTPGYFPVRFDITNLAEAREIEVVVSQDHYYNPYRSGRYGTFVGGSTNTRQKIALKRGYRVKFTMPLPVYADNENFQIRIYEGGRPVNGFTIYDSYQGAVPFAEASVLVAASSSTPLGTMALKWRRPFPTTGGPGYRFTVPPGIRGGVPVHVGPATSGGPPLDFLLEPERLPSNWLGFTSLRAVLLGPAEWNQLDSAQRDALLTWTAAGGDLLLVDGSIETVLAQASVFGSSAGNSEIQPYYFGHIHLLRSSEIRELTDVVPSKLNQSIQAIGRSALNAWGLPANRASDWNWIADRGFRLPIEGVGEVPSRAYLSILGLFVVLIGPLNYLYLWRKRRQVLLVFTVPLISAGFILLLAGYGVLAEGFDVRSRAATFTILDESAKGAATHASVSLYTGGVAPSVGLRFGSGVAVLPIGTDSYGPSAEFNLDLNGAQTFQTGLLRARTPSNYEEIVFRPARERLSFERSGNELRVVNGLGATIRQLVYREGGRLYTLSEELPAGERGSLKVQAGKVTGLADGLRRLPPGPAAKLRQVIDNQLQDGSYLAVLETSPFWEPGVDHTLESGSFHLVLGLRGNR